MASPSASFNYFSDPLPKLSISAAQFQYCSQALKLLKEEIKNPNILQQDFNQLQENRPKDFRKRCSVATENVNSNKNRYPSVLPFDENRVILKSSKGGSDYINASFMKIDSSKRVSEIIATQAPLPNTFEDFWETIIQYHCPLIVMLTPSINNNKEYPGDSLEYEKICVSTKWTRPISTSLVLCCFELKYKGSNEPAHSVFHVQYLDWPDFQVPNNTLAVREIVEMVCHVPTDLGPIVVHSGAGVGRAGTFCTMLNTIQRILDGNLSATSIVNTISTFRSQRVEMVETLDQFMFFYKAVIDELENLTK